MFKSLLYRAVDPKSFADSITRDVLQLIFGSEYKMVFNQQVIVRKELQIEKLRAEVHDVPAFQKILDHYEKLESDFLKFEIDANLFVATSPDDEQWIEIKTVTFPNQSDLVIQRHLQPKNLLNYFNVRQFLGLMGFAYLFNKEEQCPVARIKQKDKSSASAQILKDFKDFKTVEPQDILNYHGTWALHLILMDKTVLQSDLSAPEWGNLIMDGILANQTWLEKQLGLNTNVYVFKMTENYVKVEYMALIIEDLLGDIEAERREKEVERREKEAERKLKDLYKKKLIEAGIDLPDENSLK
jgi:hypothetical protein